MSAATGGQDPGAALDADGIVAGYDEPVLRDGRIRVGPGEIVGVVGPNGAGKSTLLKVIAGFLPAWAGVVRLRGADVTAAEVHERVRRGLGYVPQRRGVFPDMTVADNLRMGARAAPGDRDAAEQREAQVLELFPALASKRGGVAGSLSGGQRQMLAVARALMGAPAVLLLDEPTAGLDPRTRDELVEHLEAVNATGVAMVLVEQNVRLCLQVSARAHVYERGRCVLEGASSDLLTDPLLERVCLGGLSRRS